jgi:hypothetical protein
MYSIIRTTKHKSTNSLKSRETHTYRTRPTANADPDKFDQNRLLWGGQNYATKCAEKLEAYGKTDTVRKNAVVAIEYLLTASPEFFEDSLYVARQKTLDAWCDAQVDFLKKLHGAENILCMYLHLDEKTPHIEAFVLPLDRKGKLNCRSFLGGAKKLSELQTNYAKHNAHLGLGRGVEGSTATHQKVKQHYTAINQKSEITNSALAQALKLDKLSLPDMLKPDDYLAKQEKQLHYRMTKMFLPVVNKAKLAERAEGLVMADKKREEKMKVEAAKQEKIIRELRREAEKLAAPLAMIDNLKYEISDLKKTVAWQQEKLDALKSKVVLDKKP